MRSVGPTEVCITRIIENLVSERQPKTARDIRTLAVVGHTNGPKLPSVSLINAAPQLHQTGHSCSMSIFFQMVCHADEVNFRGMMFQGPP